MLSVNQRKTPLPSPNHPPRNSTNLLQANFFPGDFSLFPALQTGSPVQRSAGPISHRQPFPIPRKYLKYAETGYLPNAQTHIHTQTHKRVSECAQFRKSCREQQNKEFPSSASRSSRCQRVPRKGGVIDVVIRSVSLPFTHTHREKHTHTHTNTNEPSTLALAHR